MIPRSLTAAAALLAAPSAFAQSAADMDVELGVPIQATLESTDAVSDRGGYSDSYMIAGSAGTTIEVQLRSDIFDTYLYVRGPDGGDIAYDDDGGDGTNSRLHVTLPQDGPYTIIATSYSGGATGAYTLEVSEFHPVPLVATTAAMGESSDGRLEDGDSTMPAHGFVDAWDVEAGVGVELEIVMDSGEFDTYLYLIGPTGERLTSDDDGGAWGTNSRIQHTTQSEGTYRVLATSYGGYSQGAYTIRISEGFGSSNQATPLAMDEEITGTLEATPMDEFGYQPEVGDRYTIDLEAGIQAVFAMGSDDIDSYLRLLGPEGYDVASDDDGGEGLNSRLVFMVQQSGTYTLVASALSGGAGTYTLLATTEEPAEVTVEELTLGEGVSGRLETGDARSLNGGGYVDAYSFEAEAGDRVDIRVDGHEGNAHIQRILSPIGEEFGYMSRSYDGGYAGLVLPYTGEYRVLIGTYDSSDAAYTVTVAETGSPAEVDATPVEVGDAFSGTFVSTDRISAMRGTYAHDYSFVVDEAGLYTVAMNSEIIDGYLELWSGGVLLAQNDDAVGLNPAIRQFLAEGEYRIVATQYAMATGPYVLEISAAEVEPLVVEFIAPGDHVAGHLSAGDTTSTQLGGPADYYRMEVGAGQTFTITVTSDQIDPVVAVLDEFGEQIAYNDDGGDGTFNSRVPVTVATAGVISIVAGGYDQREGTYELHVFEGLVEPGVGPVQ